MLCQESLNLYIILSDLTSNYKLSKAMQDWINDSVNITVINKILEDFNAFNTQQKLMFDACKTETHSRNTHR
jgi:hypothetical protein